MAADEELAALLAIEIMEQEEADYEEMMMGIARIAAADLMELEEGPDEIGANVWVKVTVIINEYHFLCDPCFKRHFRMSRVVFERLSETIHNHLRARGRLQRERTPFQDLLLMVVWLLATPDTFRSVALRFGVLPSTLYYFYSYVIETLRELAPLFIKWPDEVEREVIKTVFEESTHFPGVIGCIDCTHINITAPVEDAVQYVNRHHSYSINVQAVVDSSLLVRQLHVGEVGSMHDSRVFRRSPLYQDLMNRGEHRIISPDEHLVGDGGYTVTDFMMIPFSNNGHLTASQLNFNRRLSQCRVRVENAFGRAKGKWRRLKFLHARNAAHVVDHITACFVLHNFIIMNGEPALEEGELRRPINNQEVLGREVVADDYDNENYEEERDAAEARGAEKRIFIMDHVLPNIVANDLLITSFKVFSLIKNYNFVLNVI